MASNVVNIFPGIVKEVLKDYPSVRDSVDTYKDAADFDSSYRPQEVNLYFDDCWVASWNSQSKVNALPALPLPISTRPEVVEIEVDGEPGLILVLGVEVLNRIEKIPGHELWMVNSDNQAA